MNWREAFAGLRIAVIGDVMLDEYLLGQATRISPEAPVMVMRQTGRKAVPGGAANVARNAAAFGSQAMLVGLIGQDEAGRELNLALQADRQVKSLLVSDPNRPTTKKTRVVAGDFHQIVRIDLEATHDVEGLAEAELKTTLTDLAAASSVLLLSDYQKGCLSESVIRHAMQEAERTSVPVVVNAKPGSAHLYRGASLVSLNRSEARAFTGEDAQNLEEAVDLADKARQLIECEVVVVTMGAQGLAASWRGGSVQVEAPRVEVSDPAGAGDTAITALALGFSAAGCHPGVFQLAVEASARVVRHPGVAVPNEDDLQELSALGIGFSG